MILVLVELTAHIRSLSLLTARIDLDIGSLTHELQILLSYGDPVIVPFAIEH
ncbi:MAG: hypothetical protein ABUT20_45785 [Bacteroidota bacterium]